MNIAFYGSAILSGISSAAIGVIIYALERLVLDGATGAEMLRLEEFRQEFEAQWVDDEGDTEDEADCYQNYEDQSSESERKPYNASNSSDQAKKEAGYKTLGVSPNASKEEINTAWRAEMKRNHPDRVADLAPEFRALAEQRATRLNVAREEGLSLNVAREEGLSQR